MSFGLSRHFTMINVEIAWQLHESVVYEIIVKILNSYLPLSVFTYIYIYIYIFTMSYSDT